jgi:hypothetical protein
MAVQNIECQIATVLMKRFLDGDNLPQSLTDDLERHLKACPTCKSILDQESADIDEILDQPQKQQSWISKLAGQPATASGFVTASAGEALMQAGARTYVPEAPGLAVLKNPKVLFLSIALAATLIVMSTVLRNPTNLLGPKAGAAYTESKEPVATEKESDHKTETDEHAKEAEHKPTEGHGDESAHSTATDSHAEEESAHPEPAKDEHTANHSEPEQGAKPQPKLVPDPRVPGKPTLGNSEIIVAGGAKTESKTDTHSAPKATQPKASTVTQPKITPKPTPKGQTKSTAPVRRAPVKKSTPKPKSTRTKPKPAPAKGNSGGIKVYDSSGKPIQ